jgi:exodeoxyribonuclease V beta subunit
MTNDLACRPLVVEDMPLNGRHLIEASAGTGKTFNIVRIYLRLLLERELSVQQILVVTFTKAATEELRGRLRQAVRDTLSHWDEADEDFIRCLSQRIPADLAKARLQVALLDMDEASIYTIHGFCKRVLSEQAFASQLPFDMTMEVDSSAYVLTAVGDAYRRLTQQPEAFELITDKWPTPESFIGTFRELLVSDAVLDVDSVDDFKAEVAEKRQQAHQALMALDEGLQILINATKGKSVERQQEYAALCHWLTLDEVMSIPAEAKAFVDKRRLKSKVLEPWRENLSQLFDQIRDCSNLADNYESSCLDLKRLALVASWLPDLQHAVRAQKRQQQALDFDDLIYQVWQALHSPEGSEESREEKAEEPLAQHSLSHQHVLRQKLAQTFPVALVDEFQDTDNKQYAIFDRIYQERDNALFMIGDPKQAIYSFRGGDIFCYLAARAHADYQWDMDTNWRSSVDMIAAYNRLFYGAPLDSAKGRDIFGYGIRYTPVLASPKAGDHIIADSAERAAMNWVHLTDLASDNNDDIFQQSALWSAMEIRRLLTEPALINGEPMRAEDIALLVKDRSEASWIKKALDHCGLSSVYLSVRDNVLLSDEANELVRVLNGILHPEDNRCLSTALATRYFNLDMPSLAQLHDDELLWEQWRNVLFELRMLWEKRSFIVMMQRIIQHYYQPIPSRTERGLTNSLHLMELLQAESLRHPLPLSLLQWFEKQREDALAASEHELRLESDEQLIRIITQHGSKGLEYPVVFIPFAARAKASSRKSVWLRYHDQQFNARYYLGTATDIQEKATEESLAEEMRLLYVAVTRAVHRCYLVTAPFKQTHLSPLGLALGLDADEGYQDKVEAMVQELPQAMVALEAPSQQMARLPKLMQQDQIALKPPQMMHRSIEKDWWLSSFSALTKNFAHRVLVKDRDDELEQPTMHPSDALRFRLQKGAKAGNLLHDILEKLDFQQPDWSELSNLDLTRFASGENDKLRQELIAWLADVLQSPLQGVSVCLADLSRQATLREAEFYFSMQQGHTSKLEAVLQRYRQAEQRPNLGSKVLTGMMHGFIDLVFTHQGKYYVVDYKSSFLGDRITDYSQEAIKDSIEESYYDLQYLIYSLALHRYLKIRLPDYSPERHFGGAIYLYLRGMAPGHTTGSYYAPISAQWLDALDQLFDGSSSTTKHDSQGEAC